VLNPLSFQPAGRGKWSRGLERIRDRMRTAGRRRGLGRLPSRVHLWAIDGLAIIDRSDPPRTNVLNAAAPSPWTFTAISHHAERRQKRWRSQYQWRTDHSDTEMRSTPTKVGAGLASAVFTVFSRSALRPRTRIGRAASDSVTASASAYLLHQDGSGRVVVASELLPLRAIPSLAGNGSHRLLALSDLNVTRPDTLFRGVFTAAPACVSIRPPLSRDVAPVV